MFNGEEVLTFVEAAAKLPRLNGKRPHASTLWRWGRRGLRGIRLEVRRVGGRFCTSIEALDRFSKELAEIDLPDRPAAPAKHATERQREQSVERAERTLAKAGIL